MIKPYHFVVFSLNLTAPDIEGNFSTEMLITTQFEVRKKSVFTNSLGKFGLVGRQIF